MNHRKSVNEAKPGDLIEIPRALGYTHWAVYIGDGYIVHLTSDGASGDMSLQLAMSEEIAVIKREPLAEVAGSDPCYVNNGSDIIWNPLPVHKIIKKAKEKIGCKVHYNVLNENCEHFVNSLRYSNSRSFQAIGTCLVILGVSLYSPAVAAVATGGAVVIGAASILKRLLS